MDVCIYDETATTSYLGDADQYEGTKKTMRSTARESTKFSVCDAERQSRNAVYPSVMRRKVHARRRRENWKTMTSDSRCRSTADPSNRAGVGSGA